MDIRATRHAAGMTQAELARAANNRRAPSPEVRSRITHALQVRPSKRVAENRERICAIVAEHHAREPRVIGSIVRGEDGPGSDLDLVVDFTEEASLLDEVGLRLELSELLGIPVDVIAADTLRGEFRERVAREAVSL